MIMDRRTLASKLGLFIASSISLLLVIVWIPKASIVGHANATTHLQRATVTGAQASPTADPTMAALEKEKLTQQVDQLKSQNSWSWTFLTEIGSLGGCISGLGTILLALAGFLTVLFGFRQWRGTLQHEREKRDAEQKVEREKRDEERFQEAVRGLGSENKETRIGAAIMLRTFLEPNYEADYKRFYGQIFDLAVAHLRMRRVLLNIKPLDSLSQALVALFTESFRPALLQKGSNFTSESLDATGVHLDKAYLRGANLEKIWMPGASLREADLVGAQLSEANLVGVNLTKANLEMTSLIGANLTDANFTDANLIDADLTGATLKGTHPEAAKSLNGTILVNVIDFDDPKQRDLCEKKGAVFVV